MFAQMMIRITGGPSIWAKLAASGASTAEVKKLAADIEAAQDPEIRQMTTWLRGWGQQVSPSTMPSMDHAEVPGGMTEADMKKLETLSGAAFDRAFPR